jgi:hypothetical protein
MYSWCHIFTFIVPIIYFAVAEETILEEFLEVVEKVKRQYIGTRLEFHEVLSSS